MSVRGPATLAPLAAQLYMVPMPFQPPRRTLIAGFGAAIATGRAGAATREAAHEPPAAPILGVLFPETGAGALDGDEAWRGVHLAVEAAGRPIRLIRADAATPAKAVDTLIHAAGGADRLAAIIGTQSSTASFAATAAAELAGVPYVELDAPADAITTRGFKMLLRTGTTTEDFAISAAAAVTGILAPGWHKAASALRIAILFDVGATDGSFAAAMLSACRVAKLPVTLSIGYAADAMDLGAEVGRLRRAKIDLLIHAGAIEHVMLLHAAMVAEAWRPRMILGVGAGYRQGAAGYELGRALDNTMVVGNPLYGPGTTALAAAYRRRYAAPPRSAASLTCHVGAGLVIEALATGKKLPAALAAIRRDRGALANGWGVRFDGNGQNRETFATLQQWRGGTLVTVDPDVKGAAKPILRL